MYCMFYRTSKHGRPNEDESSQGDGWNGPSGRCIIWYIYFLILDINYLYYSYLEIEPFLYTFETKNHTGQESNKIFIFPQ